MEGTGAPASCAPLLGTVSPRECGGRWRCQGDAPHSLPTPCPHGGVPHIQPGPGVRPSAWLCLNDLLWLGRCSAQRLFSISRQGNKCIKLN